MSMSVTKILHTSHTLYFLINIQTNMSKNILFENNFIDIYLNVKTNNRITQFIGK